LKICVTRTLCLPNVYLMCTQRVLDVLGHWLLKMCVRQPEANGAKAHFRKGHQVPRRYTFPFLPFFFFWRNCSSCLAFPKRPSSSSLVFFSFLPFYFFGPPKGPEAVSDMDLNPTPETLNPKPEAVPDVNSKALLLECACNPKPKTLNPKP
jgi:hypothetical protein